MYKLAIIHKGKVERNIRLTAGTMVIGRKAECNIQLEEKMVSGQHAQITIRPNEVILKDLGSTNGTLVNGEAVSEKTLRTGDQISIGNYKLIIVREHGETQDPDATMVVSQVDNTVPQAPAADDAGKSSSSLFVIIGIILVILVGAAVLILLQ